jgi:L-alanine-DL-glutamate epimerase-like enolase superfamily enzyme
VKIVGLDVYQHTLTYAHGSYAMSGGRVAAQQSSTLVRVRTSEGIDGWGEACPLGGTYLPSFAGAVRAALRELGPAIMDLDPREISVVGARMAATLVGFEGAKSAIDVACWDILGKAVGLPVATLLGGVQQEDFPLYEAVPLGSPEQMADYITARRAAGITCFQVKVGNRPAEDVARARAAVEVGGDSRLICDANGGWRLSDAILAVSAMADLPVYIEQPCRTLEDMGRVRAVTSLPLVADESVLDPASLVRAKEVGHAGSANLKIGRLGGLSNARRMRDLAVSLAMTVTLEDTWGGDVATAAVAHLAASTAADDMLSASFFNDWTVEHVAPDVRPVSVHGRGSAPAQPGLGVEPDVALLGAPLFSIG